MNVLSIFHKFFFFTFSFHRQVLNFSHNLTFGWECIYKPTKNNLMKKLSKTRIEYFQWIKNKYTWKIQKHLGSEVWKDWKNCDCNCLIEPRILKFWFCRIHWFFFRIGFIRMQRWVHQPAVWRVVESTLVFLMCIHTCAFYFHEQNTRDSSRFVLTPLIGSWSLGALE